MRKNHICDAKRRIHPIVAFGGFNGSSIGRYVLDERLLAKVSRIIVCCYPGKYKICGNGSINVQNIVVWLGLDANDLKLLSALVVALFLGIPYWKAKLASKNVKIKEVKE